MLFILASISLVKRSSIQVFPLLVICLSPLVSSKAFSVYLILCNFDSESLEVDLLLLIPLDRYCYSHICKFYVIISRKFSVIISSDSMPSSFSLFSHSGTLSVYWNFSCFRSNLLTSLFFFSILYTTFWIFSSPPFSNAQLFSSTYVLTNLSTHWILKFYKTCSFLKILFVSFEWFLIS